MEFIKGVKYIECPGCKKFKLNPTKTMNALSRKNDKIYVCSDCGTLEGFDSLKVIIEEIEDKKKRKKARDLFKKQREELKKFLGIN
ncbi:hypothetical protein ES702_03816 [subsurface metagenome]